MHASQDRSPTKGVIVIQSRPYLRQQLRNNPGAIFAWEDTLEHDINGGRRAALQCYGEPNAIGIVTKRMAGMAPQCFLSDEDGLPGTAVRRTIEIQVDRMSFHLDRGGTVYWPATPIGTEGCLLHRAPVLWGAIERMRLSLFRGRAIHSADLRLAS